MKNLTAHYNIYFNAKEMLEESELAIRTAREDDFSQLLEIFPLSNEESASNETENLDEVIKNANLIAIEKYESNWLDDAYLMLADAQYLKGDYYNAVEYYSYVGITFPKEKKNKLRAYLGQVKSDLALDLIKDADSVMNMAVALNYKYDKDQVAASQAKLAIVKNDIEGAIAHMKKAVGFSKKGYQKTRWQYILAQLQEINNQPEEATKNYEKIAKSNASFDMAFNANLSRIRISENSEGKDFDKIATLKKLLKEDKNRQYKDQIYYQIAKAYQDRADYEEATKYYTIAAHTQPGTAKQKGLSYLKLASLNFETLKDYSRAQLYYDSTLQFLPKDYPNYKAIANKANNLQYLADRLSIIDKQKNRLYLSSLSDEQLDKHVDSLFQDMEIAHAKKKEVTETADQLVSIPDYSSANKTASTFYFYNDAAISQGYSEFKRRWGSRKLEDNWRSSSKSSIGPAKDGSADYVAEATSDDFAQPISRDSLRNRFVKDIPYSLAQKQESHEKISKSLYEIAMFYKETLKDEPESIEAFEAIVQNYPDDKNAPNIYYQLYRLTAESNPQQSEIYKQKLLSLFPKSDYAQAIINPNYGKEKEFRINALKEEYAKTYELYNQKKYKEVFSRLNDLKPRYSAFPELQLQFSYLEALAIGHTQKTPLFLASLDRIVKTYPEDKTITPVVQHQMAFIAKNRAVFDQRPTALLTHDRNEFNYNQPQMVFTPVNVEKPKPVVPVEEKPQPEVKKEVAKVEAPKAEVPVVKEAEPMPAKEEVIAAVEPEKVSVPEVVVPEEKAVIVPEKPKGLEFSINERQRHVIVIDISDPKQNIAQPFSRLSQYFYSKFEPSQIQLLIRVVGGTEKFIIISGDFYSKEVAEEVAAELSKNLPKIMEGQTSQYKQFVISQENLKLLTDKASIDQYLKSIAPNK